MPDDTDQLIIQTLFDVLYANTHLVKLPFHIASLSSSLCQQMTHMSAIEKKFKILVRSDIKIVYASV